MSFGDGPSHLDQSSILDCSKCNQKTRARSRFCNYCGTKLDEAFITYDIVYKSTSDGIRLTIPKDWIQINPQDLPKNITDVRWAFRPSGNEGESPVLFVKSWTSPELQTASQNNSTSAMLEILVKSELGTENESWHINEYSIDSVKGIDIAKFVRQNSLDETIEFEVDTIRNAVLHMIVFRAINSYQFYYPTIDKIINSLENID